MKLWLDKCCIHHQLYLNYGTYEANNYINLLLTNSLLIGDGSSICATLDKFGSSNSSYYINIINSVIAKGFGISSSGADNININSYNSIYMAKEGYTVFNNYEEFAGTIQTSGGNLATVTSNISYPDLLAAYVTINIPNAEENTGYFGNSNYYFSNYLLVPGSPLINQGTTPTAIGWDLTTLTDVFNTTRPYNLWDIGIHEQTIETFPDRIWVKFYNKVYIHIYYNGKERFFEYKNVNGLDSWWVQIEENGYWFQLDGPQDLSGTGTLTLIVSPSLGEGSVDGYIDYDNWFVTGHSYNQYSFQNPCIFDLGTLKTFPVIVECNDNQYGPYERRLRIDNVHGSSDIGVSFSSNTVVQALNYLFVNIYGLIDSSWDIYYNPTTNSFSHSCPIIEWIGFFSQSETFEVNNTWTPPANIDTTLPIVVQFWGKRGMGRAGDGIDVIGIGGGGGAFSCSDISSGFINSIYTISFDTSISSLKLDTTDILKVANGNITGEKGNKLDCLGLVVYSGDNQDIGVGGGSAFPYQDANKGGYASGGQAGRTLDGNGGNGGTPGGGGGGGSVDGIGGLGGNGRIIFYYNLATIIPPSSSSSSNSSSSSSSSDNSIGIFLTYEQCLDSSTFAWGSFTADQWGKLCWQNFLINIFDHCTYTTPENVQLIAFTNVVDETIHPSGEWNDFNTLYKKYLLMQKLAKNGIIETRCVIEPNYLDFPNY